MGVLDPGTPTRKLTAETTGKNNLQNKSFLNPPNIAENKKPTQIFKSFSTKTPMFSAISQKQSKIFCAISIFSLKNSKSFGKI
nr:hypothetical protein [Clostridium sp. AM45-5]